MQIEITVKAVYGKELIYPVCQQAKIFAELLGTKTITRDALRQIERLGYTIVARAPTLSI